MDLINQYVQKQLISFEKEEIPFFEELYALLQNELKSEYKLLLNYFHRILTESFSIKNKGLTPLHLHFEDSFDDSALLLISEYVLIFFFKKHSQESIATSADNDSLSVIKRSLKSKQRRLESCPEDASGAKGGNKIYKNWIKDKENNESIIEFYNDIDDAIKISDKTLFNCQVGLSSSLEILFFTKPYATDIENTNTPSFNLLNSKFNFNEIDEINGELNNNLDTVILFDSERKKKMQYFSLEEVKKWNSDYSLNISNYLILTFGSKVHSIQNLRNKITLIQERFKISDIDSYAILRAEINFCLSRNSTKKINISFIGRDHSNFLDEFINQISYSELYELRSIKMKNLYSLCIRNEIRDFVISDLFSHSATSGLVSESTKEILLGLNDEDLNNLKESLINLLNLMINSDIKDIASSLISKRAAVIVDDVILKNKTLKKLITEALDLENEHLLISWGEIKTVKQKNILILAYQDQGVHSYYFNPNLLETIIPNNIKTLAVFHRLLFSNQYNWSKYSLTKEIYEFSNHPLREKFFQWRRLGRSVHDMRPKEKPSINWDSEREYSTSVSRETIKLKVKGEKEKTYNPSDLFIYSSNDVKKYQVDNIANFYDKYDPSDNYVVQHLDSIQESINIYENKADSKQAEEELRIIRQKYNLVNESSGRLWKVLLKIKSKEIGEDSLYTDLKIHLESKKLNIVSYSHFRSNWINPDSQSIAPVNRRVFSELCKFLELPASYEREIHRIKNYTKRSSSESTRRMNRLLKDLFNHGCFEDGIDPADIIHNNLYFYKRNHSIDELDFDEGSLAKNLADLVDLIRPEINLRNLENLKKLYNE